ncbi:LRR receptor serine/threonine-protein kinase RGI5 [Trifolium repens]|nr:LRR receptor serine/threonine-protein kinase RGI5 [Trifolium repens]
MEFKDEMVDSFAAEIQILGYIRHRNIVRLIEKSDVYSYGVVLLEILSGRSAVESQHVGDGQHIVEGVKKMASFEPAVLDTKLQSLPDQIVQEMLPNTWNCYVLGEFFAG